MKRGRASEPARRGFTLVELLVVIAIITILMSLLLAAVMRSVIKTEEVRARNDISQLAQAIQSFLVKYPVDYIPSRIVLREKLDKYNLNDPLEKDSISYLKRVWPRLGQTTTNNQIDWNGDGKISGRYVLEGDQCLVFFLGGIPSVSSLGCLGFSTNSANPADLTSKDRNTFYDFPSNRLVATNGFYSFKDPYGKQDGTRSSVYAYFSAYKTTNGYNRYYTYDGKSDCDTLKIWPYAEQMQVVAGQIVAKYLSPNSYQIISAGRDKQYGSGTNPAAIQLWMPKNPGAFASPPAADDMANFHDRFLGIPAN